MAFLCEIGWGGRQKKTEKLTNANSPSHSHSLTVLIPSHDSLPHTTHSLTHKQKQKHVHAHIHTHIYIFVFVFVAISIIMSIFVFIFIYNKLIMYFGGKER